MWGAVVAVRVPPDVVGMGVLRLTASAQGDTLPPAEEIGTVVVATMGAASVDSHRYGIDSNRISCCGSWIGRKAADAAGATPLPLVRHHTEGTNRWRRTPASRQPFVAASKGAQPNSCGNQTRT